MKDFWAKDLWIEKAHIEHLKQKLKRARERARKWQREMIAARAMSICNHFEITNNDSTIVDSSFDVMKTINDMKNFFTVDDTENSIELWMND